MRNFILVFALVFILGTIFFLTREKTAPVVLNSDPVEIHESEEMYEIALSAPAGLPENVNEKIRADLEKAANEFRTAANSMSDLPEFVGQLWLKNDGSREFSGDNTRSVEIVVSEYLGGAHPNAVYFVYNFMPDGTILSLGDVLENDTEKLAEVRATSAAKLIAKFGAEIEENLSGESAQVTTEQKEFALEMIQGGVSEIGFDYPTWVIDGENLVLIFPPYAVAPYASGTQVVSIPLSDI